MNLNALNFFIYNLIIIPIFVYSSSEHTRHIEDPVARHDANMCGVYLCPSLSDKATKYLEEGCINNFRDWLLDNTHISTTMSELQMNVLECDMNDNIPLELAIQLSLISFSISLFIGYNPSFSVIKQKLQIFTICFISLLKGTLAISNGANEPIADNELGLTAKDCALQYCDSKDGMALWMTLVNECISKPNPYFMTIVEQNNPIKTCEFIYGTGITPFILGSLMGFMAFVGFNVGVFLKER